MEAGWNPDVLRFFSGLLTYFDMLGAIWLPGSWWPKAFGVVAWIGVVGLVVGGWIGIRRKQPGLLVFLASPLLSQLFIMLSYHFGGAFSNAQGSWLAYTFLAVQLALLALLTIRLRYTLTAGVSLSVFCLSYASAHALIAFMALAAAWI